MVPDVESGLKIAQRIAEKSIVLLKNNGDVLPLNPSGLRSVVVIGGLADRAFLTGGGSAQVDPPGSSPIPPLPQGADLMSGFQRQSWVSDSPLRALQSKFSPGIVSYLEGDKLDEAVLAAKSADVAIVFAYQWEAEGFDLETLALSDEQNKLIEAVAEANPRTIVVLETGSPVTMPWIDRVAGVVEAWYPGIRGGEAWANILTGKVNPTGKLAMTFPKGDADLPHPNLVLPPPESAPKRPARGADPAENMGFLAKGLPAFQVY